ncbi:MAG: glycosyltransferase [Prevotella sp.]
MMKVPVILLNYNSSADCRKCVADLKRQEGVELEIIIVDNCSRKEDASAVKELAAEQDCTFIAAKENRGYNAGNNIGLRYAAEKGYAYALIANPDMEFPQRNYIVSLVNVMEKKPDVAVCGSNIIGTDNKRQNPWRFSKWWIYLPYFESILRCFNLYSRLLPPYSAYCDIVTGCCLIVRMHSICKMGFFDENVFLYCEEAILGRMVQRNGEKTYYFHDAFAKHCHIESQKGKFSKRYKTFWQSRSYYLEHYSGFNKFQLIIIGLSNFAYHWMKLLFYHLKEAI